ncbi:putative mitochondrial protein AtMg01280 [Bidens hawaiensis]|uniref:putative mitochondrial protein AtMg01280 n=1 Tax=Bidens hawaiensis TaxID=980011 RepID=UPI004049C153
MTCFRAFFPVLLFVALMMLFSLLCHVLGGISFFISIMSKVAGFRAAKGLSSCLKKGGCSSALASVIGCAFRALVTAGVGANMMNPSGGEIIPSNSGSGGPSHSNSWTEDSFSIGVLMEPFPETSTEGASTASADAGPPHVVRNASLESSMRNQIVRLEQDNSPYLLDKGKGAYWSDIKKELEHAPSQGEYNRLVSFENRDLLLRELKHEDLRLFQRVLEQNPPLADQAPYSPQEVFQDFLDEHGDELEQLQLDVYQRDQLELEFLALVRQGLKRDGPAYIRERIF